MLAGWVTKARLFALAGLIAVLTIGSVVASQGAATKTPAPTNLMAVTDSSSYAALPTPYVTTSGTITFQWTLAANTTSQCLVDKVAVTCPPPAASTTSATVTFPVTVSTLGSHTFSVAAVSSTGVASSAVSASFSYLPPSPVLTIPATFTQVTSGPPATYSTSDANPSFVWSAPPASLVAVLTAECAFDGGTFKACPPGTPAYTYQWLLSSAGPHSFAVRWASGKISSAPASVAFTFSSLPFTVSVNPGDPLAPGLARTIAVTLTNPNDVPITVTALSYTVTVQTAWVAMCPVTISNKVNNIVYTQPVLPRGGITIAAGASVDLATYPGVTLATIQLTDLPTINQDGCKGATFDLTWTGTATGGAK